MAVLDRELAAFRQHLPEMLAQHPGEVVLIKGDQILGFFDSKEAAYNAGFSKLGNVPMLIRIVKEEAPGFLPTIGNLHAPA